MGRVLADRFTLDRLAGHGAMGEVWAGRDLTGGGAVAVKLLMADVEDDGRFEREAAVLAALDHPAVVRYVDHGLAEGRRYLVMEWLEGEDLAARLRRGPLAPGEARTLLARVAGALAAAHAAGVVHRDLKPSNLFLPGGDVGEVKLIDFGVARLAGATLAATRAGHLIGTPAYMAPEQARGDRAADARLDLFALGCVVYECLAGRPAFTGEHVMAVLAKILMSEPAPLDRLRPDLPPDLCALVHQLMAKDPAQRPTDLRGDGAAARRSVLGPGEQRRLFVVVASAPGDLGHAGTMVSAPDAAAAALGARVERLHDGSLVAVLHSSGSATDASARAARLALELRRQLPGGVVALATGSGVFPQGGALPVGDVIDRAVVLMGAGGAAVRVDEAAAGLLDARFVIEGDAAGLKLVGEAAGGGAIRKLLGKPSPHVGRDRELSLLTHTLSECVGDAVARALLVTAPPGFGKSRLVHEFLRALGQRSEPVEVWPARGDALAAGSAFGLVAQLVRGAAGIREDEQLSVRQGKLRGRVARHLGAGEQAQRVAEFLGEAAGVPFPDQASVPLRVARQNAQVMTDQVTRAWEDFVRAETEQHGVVILLEDLHWGDGPSVKLVEHALRRLGDRPLLVAATARPEVHEVFPRLWAERVQEVRLSELSRRASERLVRQVLGEGISASVVDRVVTLAQGNAFYLEELIRAVAEGRDQVLPETVLAMAQTRLEALQPQLRKALRAASIFGEAFWPGGLAALLGEPADALLAELVERELCDERSPSRFAEPQFGFRHALLREAAVASLTPDDRVLGHRLAAEWLERAGENDAALLAGHFERAGEALRAASLYRRAGEQALEGGDLAAARQHAQRGLTLGAAGDDRGGLELVDIEALKWLGETTLASQHADALRQTLPVGSLLWCRAVAEAAFERPDDGELADELLGVAATRENRAILTVCLARTAIRRLIWTAQPAAALLARLEAVAAGEPMVEGWLHEARGFVAIRAEALDQGAHCMRASNAAFERVGDSRNAMSALANLGFVMADLGQFPEVERDMIALVARAEAAGVSRIVRLASTVRAIALLHMGRPAEAAALGTSMGLDAASRALRIDALAVSVLIRLALGDAAGALVVARAGPGVHRGTMTLVARILLATGSPAQALAVLDAGDTEYQGVMGANMGIGPLATLLVRAETMHALGDRAAAGGLIAAAREHSLRSAGCIADGTLRASLLATPTHARVHQLAREWGVER